MERTVDKGIKGNKCPSKRHIPFPSVILIVLLANITFHNSPYQLLVIHKSLLNRIFLLWTKARSFHTDRQLSCNTLPSHSLSSKEQGRKYDETKTQGLK